ncbi:MAG: hypothetical protein ACKPKO_30970, partial [Candidatus Fonsibacter sp.]
SLARTHNTFRRGIIISKLPFGNGSFSTCSYFSSWRTRRLSTSFAGSATSLKDRAVFDDPTGQFEYVDHKRGTTWQSPGGPTLRLINVKLHGDTAHETWATPVNWRQRIQDLAEAER